MALTELANGRYMHTITPTPGGQGNGNGGSGAGFVQIWSPGDGGNYYSASGVDNSGVTHYSSYTDGTPGSNGQIFELNGESIPTGGGGGGGAGCYLIGNTMYGWDSRQIYFSSGKGRGSAIGAGGAGGATMLTGTQGSNNVSGMNNSIIGGLAGGLVYCYKH